ncbi:MAG: hypothetical protein B7Z55_07080 [Planctomycetales bacterium 12-60-4]|nr:MAG: hypothetical protein B7Z55_07080 [Planctomycetales bacterium 12-60-4]
MKYKHEYMNMVDLGRLFGVSSHQIGKWLKELGLRRDNGTPSTAAYDQKLVSFSYERWGTYNAVWNAEKVVRILEDAGHQPVVNPPSNLVEPPTLIGPFSLRGLDGDRWQVIGSDGEAALVVTIEANARAVQRVMNIAHRAGMLDKILATTT